MADNTILFLFPDISHYSIHTGYFHYGLASISAFLKEKMKCHIKLLHIKKDLKKADFLNKIAEISPQIAAFSSTTNSFPLVKKYSKWIKEFNSDILTICGGVHAVLCPEDVILNSTLDIAIRGDGEYPMYALAEEWFKNKRIVEHKGIWYRKNGNIVDGGCSIIEELDKLPYPDWDLFDYLNLSAPKQGQGGFMMSRGCPYKCSYCCNNKIKKIYRKEGGNYIRFKSPERAISEIKAFIKKFSTIHTLYFEDDILPLNKEWFHKFTQMYKENIGKPYWCNVRPNLINDDIAKALTDSGCVRVGIGIESGNERIRNHILKRGLSDADIENAVTCLKKHNLYIYSFNMLGIPQETKNELLDTVKINGRLGINKIQATIFYPYPKTELHEFCVGENLINNSKWLIEYLGDTILKFSFSQKNRIIFTELMINPMCKLYPKLPEKTRNSFFYILYSDLTASTLLPFLNIFLKIMLKSRLLTKLFRVIYRKTITPLPKAGSFNLKEN